MGKIQVNGGDSHWSLVIGHLYVVRVYGQTCPKGWQASHIVD
ncbi:hypothetical protein [Coleofasciculus sp. E2-BRE-01]